MIRQRRLRVAVVLADETALLAQAEMHEPRVANDGALQPQKLIEIDGAAAGFADGPAPAPNAVVRRILVLNGEARFGVLEQEESRRAREQVGRRLRDGGARARLQIARGQAPQRLRP